MSKRLLFSTLFVVTIVGGYLFYRSLRSTGARSLQIMRWFRKPEEHSDWEIVQGTRCEEAPFIQPTNGIIGYLWDDSFRPGHRHQGIDIFGGTNPGETPVIAAYEGYLTRLPTWAASVIIRIPSDPLNPERQIWLYYTHMADAEGNSFIADAFPRGTREVKIPAGTLLGYQGNYSGDPLKPVGVHLHFSIVKDDGYGSFTNELEIKNTLDPSPYLGMNLNANENPKAIPTCREGREK
ncbi:MAG: M23 family metallopeptidase, partial [Anaerolineales bacterium]|nr:M23 family metallopeptidase [Anaerolineales bacterium]